MTVPTLGDATVILKRSHEVEFHTDRARALAGPIVYAWVRGDEILYVGFSSNGVARTLSRAHHRLVSMEPGDRAVIWCFETEDQAAAAERELIRLLHPPLNGRQLPGERKPRRSLGSDLETEAKSMAAGEVWTTVKETAALLHRAPKTIQNLVCKHELPRRIVRQGRASRRVMLLSFRTREKLRLLCWGPEKK
jgi:hypothetical protein